MSLTKPEIRSIEAETGVRQTELRRIFNEEMLTVADLNAGGKKSVKRSKKPKKKSKKSNKFTAAMKAKAKRTRKRTDAWLYKHPNATEIVAKGRGAYRKVYEGLAYKTVGGLLKKDIEKKTTGRGKTKKVRYVSKKRSRIGKKRYKENSLDLYQEIQDLNAEGRVPKRWVNEKGNATFRYEGKRKTVKAKRRKSKSKSRK